jgi:hypothetical protein
MEMELWMNKNQDGLQNGPWERVYQTNDIGGWGTEGQECGGAPDQIITWGSPIATFRWDAVMVRIFQKFFLKISTYYNDNI